MDQCTGARERHQRARGLVSRAKTPAYPAQIWPLALTLGGSSHSRLLRVVTWRSNTKGGKRTWYPSGSASHGRCSPSVGEHYCNPAAGKAMHKQALRGQPTSCPHTSQLLRCMLLCWQCKTPPIGSHAALTASGSQHDGTSHRAIQPNPSHPAHSNPGNIYRTVYI